jgi:hypothetical protein
VSLYKNLDRELAQLEDPAVESIKLQKDLHRPENSFRSTIYNVASHRGISVSVKNIAPCVYEITRKRNDVSLAFKGEVKVEKTTAMITKELNEMTLIATLIFFQHGVISSMEFFSWSIHNMDPYLDSVKDNGLWEVFEAIVKENTENSLVLRKYNESDKLLEESRKV